MRLQAGGRMDAAMGCYDELIAVAPDHADALCMRAQIHFRKKRFRDAIADPERARKAHPDNPQLRYFLAYNLHKMTRPFEALRILKRTLKLAPEFALARLLMARIHAGTGRIEDGRRCLAGGPHDFEAPLERLTHFNFLLALQCFDEAKHVLDELIQSRQRLPDCLYELTRLPGVHWNAAHKDMITGFLTDGELATEDRIPLEFASGRIADFEQRFDQAFDHFRAANELQSANFDVEM